MTIETANQTILKTEDLRMSYGEKQVLKGINLEISKGQVIGYIGPNGAGKSTTIKILLGLEEGYKGTVTLFGHDISSGDVEYKRRIGYVPETAEVYDHLTAEEYLLFIGGLYGMEEDEIDVKGKKMMNLFGLEDVYHSRIASLSKGMRQKVLIIASLIHNPDLIILDEPINGLDANSVTVFKEILAQLAKRGKTIFYSSHIMDVVEKISDRIILLFDGQIVADGSFDQLKSQHSEGTLEEIFTELTGFNDHKDIAYAFVSAVEGGLP
ncbi:MAG: ABC transporter ATP-binding protein [Tuberibacillus sp.]